MNEITSFYRFFYFFLLGALVVQRKIIIFNAILNLLFFNYTCSTLFVKVNY